jgi:hypothetical protein
VQRKIGLHHIPDFFLGNVTGEVDCVSYQCVFAKAIKKLCSPISCRSGLPKK